MRVKVPLGEQQFHVHLGSQYYVSQLDTKLAWSVRDLKKHHRDASVEQSLNEAKLAAQMFLKSEAGKVKMTDFLKDCVHVFHQLLNRPREFVHEQFAKQKFIFILGAVRSGGTYLYAELNKAYGIDYLEKCESMVHDAFPHYDLCYHYQSPPQFSALLFELAQFLLWAKRECSQDPVIIQKRTAYAHCLPLLDKLFGEKGQYLVTVRHPYAVAKSYEKLVFGEAPKFWQEMLGDNFLLDYESLDYSYKVLYYWKKIYEDVLMNYLSHQKCKFLFFGDFQNYLREEAFASHYQPEAFLTHPTSVPDEFQTQFEALWTDLRSLAKLKGCELPQFLSQI